MTEHYYTKKPTSIENKKTISVMIKGVSLKLYTSSGIFSKKKVDLGTKILLENLEIKPNSMILDMGCGYGVVGITITKIFQNTVVVMSDVNERATKLAKENSKLNLVIADVRTGEGYDPVAGQTFDYIILNPPQNAGREVCFKLIEESLIHFNTGGIFYLVARHKKGGEILEKKMKEVFGNVETIAKESGFRVYKSIKE